MKKTLRNLWKDEAAQGTTEYILMLVIVVAIAFAFKGKILTIIESKVESVGNDISGFSGNN